jgi:hypothetical protein
VHAVAALLAHRDVGGPGVLGQDLVEVILVGERADRGGVPDEHLWTIACRAAVLDVVDERPANILQQRQLLDAKQDADDRVTVVVDEAA